MRKYTIFFLEIYALLGNFVDKISPVCYIKSRNLQEVFYEKNTCFHTLRFFLL